MAAPAAQVCCKGTELKEPGPEVTGETVTLLIHLVKHVIECVTKQLLQSSKNKLKITEPRGKGQESQQNHECTVHTHNCPMPLPAKLQQLWLTVQNKELSVCSSHH